ncbi:MAG: hypothetical protein LBU39_10695 [Desulfobulbaceae bacterium]|nr:hypothetical protein [Desulfobulbaceae bacterium]
MPIIAPEIFESLMMICFGLSWPASVIKSWNSRTAKGKSLFFLIFVVFGYLSGIAAKLVVGHISYVLFFYLVNLLLVLTDLALYFRNLAFDRKKQA